MTGPYFQLQTLCLILSLTAVTHASPTPDLSALMTKQGTSLTNYITCPSKIPVTLSWPEDVREKMYPSLTAICAYSQEYFNIGCVCREPGAAVSCHKTLRSPIWKSNIFFPSWCTMMCSCGNEPMDLNGTKKDTEAVRAGSGNGGFVDLGQYHDPNGEVGGAGDLMFDMENIDPNAGAGNQNTNQNSATTNGTTTDFTQDYQPVNPPAIGDPPPAQLPPSSGSSSSNQPAQPPAATCPTSCNNADASCGGAVEDGKPCRCAAKPTSAGSYFFAGLCTTLKLRKRGDAAGGAAGGEMALQLQEGWGCACNGSYVSRGCCGEGVRGGMVWEGVEQKMGVLDLRGD